MKDDFKGKFPSFQAPEGFYENLTERVMAEAKRRNKHAQIRKIAFSIAGAAILLVAVLLLSIQTERPQAEQMFTQTIMNPVADTPLAKASVQESKPIIRRVSTSPKAPSHETIDQLIATMSDEELSSLYSSYQSDYFYYSYN